MAYFCSICILFRCLRFIVFSHTCAFVIWIYNLYMLGFVLDFIKLYLFVNWWNLYRIFDLGVSAGIFQWWWEMFPFFLALFMVSVSNKSINKMFLSVYFSGDGTCFPFFWHCSVIINAFFYQWNHRQNGNFNALTINAHFYWGTLSLTKWVFQGGGN